MSTHRNDRDSFRVDCHDTSVPNRQRATEILKNIASVDQCTSGVGYAYDERQFIVCGGRLVARRRDDGRRVAAV